MTMGGAFVILLALGAFAVALHIFAWYLKQRHIYRPHSHSQPERRQREQPLGYEAIDMSVVDRATRRNESLERGNHIRTRWGGGYTQAAETDVQPLADDETYAARFHDAFQKNKDRQK